MKCVLVMAAAVAMKSASAAEWSYAPFDADAYRPSAAAPVLENRKPVPPAEL